MENGPEAEKLETMAKTKKGPRPRKLGKNGPKKCPQKMDKNDPNPVFFAMFWAIFFQCRAVGHFCNVLPFRPVFPFFRVTAWLATLVHFFLSNHCIWGPCQPMPAGRSFRSFSKGSPCLQPRKRSGKTHLKRGPKKEANKKRVILKGCKKKGPKKKKIKKVVWVALN